MSEFEESHKEFLDAAAQVLKVAKNIPSFTTVDELLDWEVGDDEAYSQLDTRLQVYRSSTHTYNDGMLVTMYVPTGKGSNVLRFENMQTELEIDLAETTEYTNTYPINADGDHFGVHLTCY